MKARYLIRFDDICPTMNWTIWEQVEQVLRTYHVQPILAVVPDNQDPRATGGTAPCGLLGMAIREVRAGMDDRHSWLSTPVRNRECRTTGHQRPQRVCGVAVGATARKNSEGASDFPPTADSPAGVRGAGTQFGQAYPYCATGQWHQSGQ